MYCMWTERLHCSFKYSELQQCKRNVVLISVIGAREIRYELREKIAVSV
jgi:hypothetical protein